MTDLGVRIEALVEDRTIPPVPLPAELEAAYGGELRLADEIVYANFVASIDGVAAIEGVRMSSSVISGGAASDRFTMALLRASADAVVVGAGTVGEHGGPWTADRAFPPGAELFGRVRASLGLAATPMLVAVTASGRFPSHGAAVSSAVVATTSRGARSLRDAGIEPLEVLDLGDTRAVDAAELVRVLRGRGYRRILTEGGPRLMSTMLDPSVVDELFLTVSPRILGGAPGRSPLSADRDLLGAELSGRLLEVRRAADYLFLRYRLAAGSPPRASSSAMSSN